MRRVAMTSGGLVSWMTAKRVAQRHGIRGLSLLFADTLIEDDDLYRFVVEGSANVLQHPSPMKPLQGLLDNIPPLDHLPERKGHMRRLAQEAMLAVPGLHWVQDGRTPWEVFRDERFMGNSRVAKCSHILKQGQCRKWLDENCTPGDTTIYLGIGAGESERFTGTKDRRGAKELWLPWLAEAPLIEDWLLRRYHIIEELNKDGIAPPRLYEMGFAHNNCGGFCVRAGQAHFKRLLDEMPERYAYHERQEAELRDHLGKDVSILRDRTGGQTVPLTMVEFRERVEAGREYDLFSFGGCGCFTCPERNAG